MTGRADSIRPSTHWRPFTASMRVLISLALLSALPLGATAQVKEVRRVLLLYAMGPSSPTISLIDRQIRALLEESPYQIEFYTEYMDTNLFPDEASQQDIRNWYIHKYRDRRPDVIVALAAPPIQFMVDSHATLFPDTPIVFCCARENQTPKLDSQFAGVWTRLDPAKTLEAALRLQPGTKHVVVVGGATESDRELVSFIRRSLHSYEGKLDFAYLTDVAMPVLLERLQHLPQHSIILYANIQQDAAGHYLSATQALPMVTKAADAPVFVIADTLVDQGAVGGYVASFAAQGQVLSEMVIRILKGERPQDIATVNGANTYMFDWRGMKRWGLKESALPPGSIVLNRPPTAWETYRRYTIGAILLGLAETLLIFALLWQRAKRRKVEESLVEQLAFESLLSELSATFINLPEEQVDANIEQGLGRIAEFLRIDRVTLFELSPDTAEMRSAFSSAGTGINPAPPFVKAADLPSWRIRLLRGEVAFASDLNDLPEEAVSERAYFRKMGILSAASVPLKLGGEINGAISFVSTKCHLIWTENLLNQVRVLGEVFWNALKRKHTMQALLSSNTELKRSEGVLRESERRFRLVADTTPALIWMSGTDKLCIFFNKGWLDFTGRTMEEELGEGWAAGVHPDDLEHCLGIYSGAFDARMDFELEYRLRRFDGEYRWIVDYGVPRFETDGTFRGYIGSCVDITERKSSEESLQNLSGQLIRAQEEERARIARELHDDFSQRLALLGIGLGQLWKELPESEVQERIKLLEMLKGIQEMSSDLHGLSHQLHSSRLEHVGLVSALNGLCKELGEKYRIEVHFAAREFPLNIPKDVQLCLFRVTQEALGNVVKHSQAKSAQVELGTNANGISLRITDAGRGFEPDLNNPAAGIGLVGMRERLRLVGGRLSVKSGFMQGTEVLAEVPLAGIAGQGTSEQKHHKAGA
jgi:PAS domain S-box-containing protein